MKVTHHMNDNEKIETSSPWLAGGLFAGGAVALGLTALMNFKLGQNLGADFISGLIQGSSHIVIDVFAALGFVTAGVLIARKNMLAGGLSFILALAFASYSIANIIGYSATNRGAVVAASALNAKRFTQMADNATATRAEALKWAMSTATDKSKYRSMREPMTELVAKLATAPQAEFKAVTAREIMPDAQADIIADLANTSQKNAQIALSIAMAVLLVLAKAFGFGFGGFLWPKPGKKAVKIDQEPKQDLQKKLAPGTPVFNLGSYRQGDQVPINHILAFSELNKPGAHSFDELWRRWEIYQSDTGCETLKPWALANSLKPFGWHKNKRGLWVKSPLQIAA